MCLSGLIYAATLRADHKKDCFVVFFLKQHNFLVTNFQMLNRNPQLIKLGQV